MLIFKFKNNFYDHFRGNLDDLFRENKNPRLGLRVVRQVITPFPTFKPSLNMSETSKTIAMSNHKTICNSQSCAIIKLLLRRLCRMNYGDVHFCYERTCDVSDFPLIFLKNDLLCFPMPLIITSSIPSFQMEMWIMDRCSKPAQREPCINMSFSPFRTVLDVF